MVFKEYKEPTKTGDYSLLYYIVENPPEGDIKLYSNLGDRIDINLKDKIFVVKADKDVDEDDIDGGILSEDKRSLYSEKGIYIMDKNGEIIYNISCGAFDLIDDQYILEEWIFSMYEFNIDAFLDDFNLRRMYNIETPCVIAYIFDE